MENDTGSIMWNPWHGCHKCSPGCLNCYMYSMDSVYGVNSNIVTKSKTKFDLPIKKNRYGEYIVQSGTSVATCFTSDFFIEEADTWRSDTWDMMYARQDLRFFMITKRIHRVLECLPNNWGEGYPNVRLGLTCECQAKADERIPQFLKIPAKSKQIVVAPILEYVDLTTWLGSGEIESVSIGGESYRGARICDFDWVRRINDDCIRFDVECIFHQTGTYLRKDGKMYHLTHEQEYSQAKKVTAAWKAGIRV